MVMTEAKHAKAKHHRVAKIKRAPNYLKIGLVVWLLLLSAAVMALAAWVSLERSISIATDNNVLRLMQTNASSSMPTPLVDVEKKLFILPDAKLAFAYKPGLNELRYSSGALWSPTENKEFGQEITLTLTSTMNAAINFRSYEPSPTSDVVFPLRYNCQMVLRLTTAATNNETPLTTVYLNDGRTLYAYPAANQADCGGIWTPDNLLAQFVDLANTAQAYEF